VIKNIRQINATKIIRYVTGLLLPVFISSPYWSRKRGEAIIRAENDSGINPVSTS
jgi:hypothetical protein